MTAIELGKLINVARQAVAGHIDTDAHTKAALSQIIQVGTSAGGARAKATVAWNPATDELRAGQFDVVDGFEHWLLKFDGVGADHMLGTGKDYGRIEYAYYLMAVDSGIRYALWRTSTTSKRQRTATTSYSARCKHLNCQELILSKRCAAWSLM